jgi:hypothetical protein
LPAYYIIFGPGKFSLYRFLAILRLASASYYFTIVFDFKISSISLKLELLKEDFLFYVD